MREGVVNPDNVILLAAVLDGIVPAADYRKTVFKGSRYGVDHTINMIIIVPIQEVSGRPPVLVIIQTLIVEFAHGVFRFVAISAKSVEIIDNPAVLNVRVCGLHIVGVDDENAILVVLCLGVIRAVGQLRPDILHVGSEHATFSLPLALQEVSHGGKAHLIGIFLHQALGLVVAAVFDTVLLQPLGGVAHLDPGVEGPRYLVVAVLVVVGATTRTM